MMEGFDEVNQKLKDFIRKAKVNMSERAVTEALISAGGHAATMTPSATSNLINSQYRNTKVTPMGIDGEIGYTANYAIFVHNAPGKLKGTNTERSPKTLGYVWDPAAEPGFLTKGVKEMIESDIEVILRRNYQL